MGLMRKGRINIVITNRVLRYSYHKHATLDSLVDQGELELPHETIKDGAIINRSVLVTILSKLVRKKRWKRKDLFFCLPDDAVVIRPLQVPAALTEEEAISYLKNQLGNSFFLPFANPSISVEFLDEENQQRNILLYAYPKDKIVAFEEVFREAGLKPVVADLTSLSVYRYYYKRYRKENDHVLHIQWNLDALILTAFHNHKAVFTRYIKQSLNEQQLDLSRSEVEGIINEYSIEVNRIIDFYQYSISNGQANINLVLLSGDFPYLSEVQKSLKERISAEIFSFSDNEEELKYIDVLGLALKPYDLKKGSNT
ncbi:type IV pilus biogenesis protein PilM [Ornithinibacillus californiensis]|uniref:type IV pilus biogenesis protein PilM n=1 Tax=Ornithinibacillus californiensis TaxID=161536 RepID=UPI00064D7B8E|nr:pilus assembly protein PilM [Ornithinibacillus californiensis]